MSAIHDTASGKSSVYTLLHMRMPHDRRWTNLAGATLISTAPTPYTASEMCFVYRSAIVSELGLLVNKS